MRPDRSVVGQLLALRRLVGGAVGVVLLALRRDASGAVKS